MIEVWKRVVGFPNYQVSNLGNVIGPRGPMKPVLQDSGYYHVGLINNGRQSFRILSRLVCEAFHGSPPFDNAKALHKGDRVKYSQEARRRGIYYKKNPDRLATIIGGSKHPDCVRVWWDDTKPTSTVTINKLFLEVVSEHSGI